MVTPPTLLTLEVVNKMIEECFAEMKRKKVGVFVLNSNVVLPPFVEIQYTQLLPRFSFPQIIVYDGTTDPQDYVWRHVTSLLGRTTDENVKCLLFPATLTGGTAEWFSLLPTGSIKSFKQLLDTFV
ncbi:hypothetical protein CRG98_020298 [Punica granatum]|uniref:Uncharacterized protein n=1 Tax=Punica granatum TaxID=22663 RepID=A0A2I0JV17_PUNGR|nr:hypothetical protein CRG98_020298 [Punica granatum]